MAYLVRRSVVVVVMALMAVTTARRVQVWESDFRLWSEAVAHSPHKPRPWINLGHEYELRGADSLAEHAFRDAVRFADVPMRARVEGSMRARHTALLNLAILAANHGRYIEALALTSEIQPRAASGSITDRLEVGWRTVLETRVAFSSRF